MDFARGAKYGDATDIIRSQQRFIATMQGRTAAFSTFSDAQFDECVFTARDEPPEGSSFAFSDLRSARFMKCDLSLCQFERSDLFAVEMDQCNLRGARFHKADFSQAFSRKVVVTRATFRNCNMDFADLSEARLAECDLSESRLREADLSAADLTGAGGQVDEITLDLWRDLCSGIRHTGRLLR